MIKVNKDTVKDSIDFYGKELQTTVCMEECAELIQAISKEKRGKHDKYHLVEEIADVSICLEILKEVYCISDEELQSVIYSKQQREVERMTGKKCINESEEYHGCLDGGNKR